MYLLQNQFFICIRYGGLGQRNIGLSHSVILLYISSFAFSGETFSRLTVYIIPIIFYFHQFQKTIPQAPFLLHFPPDLGEEKSKAK